MPSSSQSNNGSIDVHLSSSTKRGQQPPDELKNPFHSSRNFVDRIHCSHTITQRRDMHVLLIQVDGKLPNLALMKLAHWHRSQGHKVTLIRRRRRDLFDRPTIQSMLPRSSATATSSFHKLEATGRTSSLVAPEPPTDSLWNQSLAKITNSTIIKTIRISQNLLVSQNAA